MRLQKIPLRSTHAFSEFFLKYIECDPALQPFYSRFPDLANFKDQIEEKSKSFPESSRKILVSALQKQYLKTPAQDQRVKENIQSLLQKNSFTITTGHQLNIFTGPLYFIYKIVTVINTCKRLKAAYPDYNFIPVYWMASEDHDYEEIKSFRLYGKQYNWETNQTGAVGRFTTKEFATLISQLPGDVSIFKQAYLKNELLSDAVRHYTNALFGKEGLVVLDADDPTLKQLFQPVIRDDLFIHTPHSVVADTYSRLKTLGFHPQVNSREVNFFYLENNVRSRLEKRVEDFIVVDSPRAFSKNEIEKMIKEEPEKFSPNVILRPLYQEMILPNLAYVGGPAEVVYWLQLKSLFEFFQIPFPILLPRNFALIIDLPLSRKISKTGLDVKDFFEEKNYLFNHWVSRNSSQDLSLGKAMKTLEQLLAEIQGRSTNIDPTLGPMVQGEAKRMNTSLEKIEKKMMRAEKRHQSDRLRQIETIKDALFPAGDLQERTDNFLNFYQQDREFIHGLLKEVDPFDFRFNIVEYK